MSGVGDARILVADDVPENVRLLEAVLAPRGYDVVSATDGHAGLELAESAKPDLVLLDVMMPQPDGYAVCRRLREREETAMLPVIMLTASGGRRRRRRSRPVRTTLGGSGGISVLAVTDLAGNTKKSSPTTRPNPTGAP